MKSFSYIPEIRFADIDAMGHVNNAVYLTYFEQTRIHFFHAVAGGKWDWNELGILVAKSEINYFKPVHLGDIVEIKTYCVHFGTKSFSVKYELWRGEELCTTGVAVLVCFNHNEKVTIEMPELWRSRLQEYFIEVPKA